MAELPPLVIRCDASGRIGLGHFARCRAIALEAARKRAVLFATCDDPSNPLLQEQEIAVIRKGSGEPEEEFLAGVLREHPGATLLTDMRYPYAAAFIEELSDRCAGIVLMDTICPGIAAADRVVYPAAHLDHRLLDGLLSSECRARVLEGPEYVVIRPEVLDLSQGRPPGETAGREEKPRLAVTTGGGDPAGVMVHLLPWIAEYVGERPVQADLLVGEAFQDDRYLARLAQDPPGGVQVCRFDPAILAGCDAALSTFGVTVYELLYLGKPTVCVSHSRENAASARVLAERLQGVLDAGFFRDLEKETLFRLLDAAMEKSALGRLPGNERLDGKGAARIAAVLEAVALEAPAREASS